jgi:hypothetical protein
MDGWTLGGHKALSGARTKVDTSPEAPQPNRASGHELPIHDPRHLNQSTGLYSEFFPFHSSTTGGT